MTYLVVRDFIHRLKMVEAVLKYFIVIKKILRVTKTVLDILENKYLFFADKKKGKIKRSRLSLS